MLGNITVGENSRVGAGSVVLTDVPPNSTVVGVPAHIVYSNGQRVLITDPHDVKDPLSDALIALSSRVEMIEGQLGGLDQWARPFQDEEAERTAYREELEHLARSTWRWAKESEVRERGYQGARCRESPSTIFQATLGRKLALHCCVHSRCSLCLLPN